MYTNKKKLLILLSYKSYNNNESIMSFSTFHHRIPILNEKTNNTFYIKLVK